MTWRAGRFPPSNTPSLRASLSGDYSMRRAARSPCASSRPPRWPAVIVAVIAPIAAAALYWQLGTPGALSPQAAIAQDASQPSREQIDAMIAQVKQRLEKEPNNVEGWAILARTHYTMGNFQRQPPRMQRSARCSLRRRLAGRLRRRAGDESGTKFCRQADGARAPGAEDRSDPMEGARDGRLGSVRPQGLQGCRRVLAALQDTTPADSRSGSAFKAASTKRARRRECRRSRRRKRAVRRAAPRRPQRQRDGHAEPNPRIESAA